jgi:hypothetical protein
MSIQISFPGARLSLPRFKADFEGKESQLRISYPYGVFLIPKSEIDGMATIVNGNCVVLSISLKEEKLPLQIKFYNLNKLDMEFLRMMTEQPKPDQSSEFHLVTTSDMKSWLEPFITDD